MRLATYVRGRQSERFDSAPGHVTESEYQEHIEWWAAYFRLLAELSR